MAKSRKPQKPVEPPDEETDFVKKLFPRPDSNGVDLGYLSRRWGAIFMLVWPILVGGVILYFLIGR